MPVICRSGELWRLINKEVEVWGFEHISVEEEKLGLKGSPTRVWKSFTKGAKAAGKVFEVEPAEAARYNRREIERKIYNLMNR